MTPTTRRAVRSVLAPVLVLLLAAAWSARAQDAATTPQAPPPSETPTLAVTVGLGGLLTYQADCVPVRIDVTGGTRAFDGILRLRSDQHDETIYEIPVQAEPGARRRLHEVVCAPQSFRWSWSLEGGEWKEATALTAGGMPLVAVIGEDVGRITALEEAVGSTSAPTETQTALLAPDQVPLDAAAWCTAPVVVLDARVASSLSAEALSGLRDHVVAGGTLVVAGAESSNLRADLVAAWPVGSEPATLTGADGATIEVPALRFGDDRAWHASRGLGQGNLVMLGLDLHEAAVRDSLEADDWRFILRQASGGAAWLAIPAPTWGPGVEAALQADRDARLPQSPVPPLLAAVYLVFAGAGLGVGSWVLGRKTQGVPRRRDVVLLVAGLALPGFVVGFFRGRAEVVPTRVVEYWPGLQRSRVVSWTPIERATPIPLPSGVHVADADGVFMKSFPAATWRLGARPSLDVREVPRFAELQVRTTEWRDTTATELGAARIRSPGWLDLPPSGTAQGVTGPDAALITAIGNAAQSSGFGKGVVLLEQRERDEPRVVWIVHEVEP